MAEYGLRYFKELTHDDGTVVRFEIHKKIVGDDVLFQNKIGGVVQGLSLQIQGQQGDIDTPIVKTSLSMTFVDAPDLNDWRKTGNWEEFYTADATMWKVIVMVNGTAIWGGYITPDSFSEDLVYHGSVNIIARDNIGHLQDFEFDAPGGGDGMISLYDLVLAGWAKIESPMTLDWFGDGNGVEWLMCEGKPMYDTRMNVSIFEGMNWYEAIEKALYSYGLVMRYVGRNRVHICPLKDMPKHGYHDYDYFGTIEPKFVSGARRELVPAVKMIEDNDAYEIEDELPQKQVTAEDFTGVQATYRCKIEGDNFGKLEHDAPVWPIVSNNFAEGWGNNANDTLFFDPSRYETGYFTERRGGDEEMRKYMYIAANNVDERSVRFVRYISASDCTIRMKFGRPIALNNGQLEQQSVFNLSRLVYSVRIEQDDVVYHYAGNGAWVTDERQLEQTFDTNSEATEFSVVVSVSPEIVEGSENELTVLVFTIHKIEYRQMGYGSLQDVGLYACIQELALTVPDTQRVMQNNTVKTVYNEGNNVILKRDPELAPAYDVVFLPGIIKNGIFAESILKRIPAKQWYYEGNEADKQELAVHIHKQLLCYYHKPNNLITGTLVNMGTLFPGCNVIWREREHMLISGTLNLLTLQVESAVLREFVRYEDMWKDNGVELVSVEHKASMTR